MEAPRMARKVWFQLVDEATRDAYANTTVDSLRLPEANLRVYANRAVYNDENGQPLEEDGSIGAHSSQKFISELRRDPIRAECYLCRPDR
ncbi:hypothetical protein F443_22863, partial [Phytophthora nicotianae P1569]